MTRRFSIFLLLILLVNLAGFYGYFIFRLNQIHEESRATLKFLPESELEYFRLTPKDYTRAKVNNREILINGKMYDVARINVSKEKVEVYALHDEAEDDLLAFIREVMNNAEKDGQAPSVFSQFTSLQFLQPALGCLPDLSGIQIIHRTGLVLSSFNASQTVLSPPPRSV